MTNIKSNIPIEDIEAYEASKMYELIHKPKNINESISIDDNDGKHIKIIKWLFGVWISILLLITASFYIIEKLYLS